MARILGLVSTVIFFCSSMVGAADPNVTCGNIYNNTNGKVQYFNSSGDSVPENIECEWTISFSDSKSTQEVFLVMTEFRFFDDDKLQIYENSGSGKKPLNIGLFSGQRGQFSVLTGVPNIKVVLKTSKEKSFTRKFQMYYYTTLGCRHNFTGVTIGTIQSPTYDLNRTTPFNCTFSFSIHGKEGFKLATIVTPLQPPLPNLQLIVTGSERDKNYTGLNSSVEYISSDVLHLTTSVKPDGKSLQQVLIVYEAVTKECSGIQELKKGDTFVFKSPLSTEASVSLSPSLNCRYIILKEDSVVALTVQVHAHTLPGALDQLQVLNGIDRQSESILQLTSSNEKEWEDQYILTNRENLSISLLSSFPSPKLNVTITIGTADYGGYFEGNGTIGVSNQKSNPAIFLLKVDPKKQVKLDLGKMSYKQGNLKFFYNFEKATKPFAELASMRQATSFISPSPLMMIHASNFGTEVFNATFDSVERGCFSSGTDDVGSYNLFGKCAPICAWTVAAKENATNKEMRKLHFSSILLNPDDDLRIVQMDNTTLANVTGPLSRLPDFDLLAKDGVNVIVRRNCSVNGTSIVADYAPIPNCEQNVTLETGKSLILSSPGYPNSYPVKSDCLWKIQVKTSNLIHVNFKSLQLGGSDHTLSLTTSASVEEKLLVKFVGPTGPNDTLPQDYIVSANLTIDFTGGAYNRTIEGSVYGFQINLTAADCGGVLTRQSDNFSTPMTPEKKNMTDAKLCYWLVDLVNNKTKNIVLYNSTMSTTTPIGYLEIHEGDSVRDQTSPNLTGTNLLSRLDRVLFVYKNLNSTPGPVVSVSYTATPCNVSSMCGNGICMHTSWMCDGKNDCGDWSDEKYCNSTCPSPSPPGPTPSPPPPSPAGVSQTALALAILAALLIGTLLGFAAPAAYRRIRTGQFGSYSSFTNNVDT